MRLARYFLLGFALSLAGGADRASAATLVLQSATVVTSAPGSPVDLADLGKIDWAYFIQTGTALPSQAPSNDKSGGTVISSVSQVGGTTLRGSTNGAVETYSFSGGTSPTSGTVPTNSSFLFNSSLGTVGAGVSFTLAGDTTTARVATLYMPAFSANTRLTLTLSGATTVIDTSQSVPTAMPKQVAVYKILYQPNNAGDLLNVEYVLASRILDDGNAHVGVQAVAVSAVPEPSAALSLLGGLGLLAVRRRRR